MIKVEIGPNPIDRMPTAYQPLFPDPFLVAQWTVEFRQFQASPRAAELLQRLRDWSEKEFQKETAAEGAFVDIFFKRTWGYVASGEGPGVEGYTCEPQMAVARAGQSGGTGAADLALGWFGRAGVADTPQVLCEFKDVRSGLDKEQKRKGNDRSPVKQCADYLKEAANALYGNEPIQPTWGLVSDMNEFRLYWRRRMPSQYQRFVLRPAPGDDAIPMLGDGEDAAFQRFVFWKMLQRDMLLTTGGPSPLEKLLTEQRILERAIERDFYREYQAYRDVVFHALSGANPTFAGTRGKLVRLTQRFLDRCIFVLFCEDMGAALNFPHNILRDVLLGISQDPDYDPEDDVAWTKVKKLFVAMRDGSPFRDHRINRFNGGLFAPEPELESLHIPSRLFCMKGQGADADSIIQYKQTLLFFSANYNFGVSSGTLERSVGIDTLGRIFEQSITELEFMEAKADGRASITDLSKRKRDGVYYTPEWVTDYLVSETVGAHLTDVRRRLSLDPLPVFTAEELAHYRSARASGKRDRRYNTERVEQYLASLDRLDAEIDDIKVVDPACGSGAFLSQALDLLVEERRWLATERARVTGAASLFDADGVTKAILAKNIYGVDINEESIEITRLALWLHTALPDRPLSSLDHNIRCGNSLIGSEFYAFKQEALFSVDEKERINVFDWRRAFPEVFGRPGGKSGFDVVVGNPPYVKLQHFRQVLPEVAEYLLGAQRADGRGPIFASTQTQNFDMYLPFIERGIELLNEGGRMGYIAPSVWLINEYGEGLRRKILETRRLERWVDFKDLPVFDEAMTYTALQFFRGHACDTFGCVFSPDGEVATIDWRHPDTALAFSSLKAEEPWLIIPQRERALIDRLNATCIALSACANTQVGVRGVETGADEFYHFKNVAPGRWTHAKGAAPKDNAEEAHSEIELEDALLRPLVSGAEARRYTRPVTDTFVLFPYDVSSRSRLLSQTELEMRYPQAWRYFKKHERALRARERGRMNRDDGWWGYNYPKNMDKHHLPKLGVAQTIPEMRVFYDERGACCFNNVRVSAIIVDGEERAFFLMGVLNSRVVDFVFRRIAKSKEPRPSGAYFEANKQYIAPLPVPPVADADATRIAGLGRELQDLHTKRRDIVSAIEERLASDQMADASRPHEWLWADVGDVAYWTARSTEKLKGKALTMWAKEKRQEKLEVHLAEIGRNMIFGATMCASERNGELKFFVGGRCVISGVYVDEREAALILAQWRHKARDTFVSDTMNATALVRMLLDLRSTTNLALVDQLRRLTSELETTEEKIREKERQLDDIAYELYGLSPEERLMVEVDTQPRWDARIPAVPA